MSDPPRSRGASVRAVGDTSRLNLTPVLDALLERLNRDDAPRWIAARTAPSGCALSIAPGRLIEGVARAIAAAAEDGYIIAQRRGSAREIPRVGCLRDDPTDDERIQEVARAIGAAVRRALDALSPDDLLVTERDRGALRGLMEGRGEALPGIDVEAPCERVELSVARDARARRRASALVFLLEETIDLAEARAQLLYAVRSHRQRAGIDPSLLGAVDGARFEESDWQLRRFLDFLLERGLARVHADVGVELLARVAAVAEKRRALDGADDLVEYVRRVQLLRATFDLDDPIVEDQRGVHHLADDVRTIRFARHLPLAILHDEQRFERRGADAIRRRITYRVRVNGTRPRPTGASPLEEACARDRPLVSKRPARRLRLARRRPVGAREGPPFR